MSAGQTAKHYMPFGAISAYQNTFQRRARAFNPALDGPLDNVPHNILYPTSDQRQSFSTDFSRLPNRATGESLTASVLHICLAGIPRTGRFSLLPTLQSKYVAGFIPDRRQISATVVNSSSNLTRTAFWASVNLDAFNAPARKIAVGTLIQNSPDSRHRATLFYVGGTNLPNGFLIFLTLIKTTKIGSIWRDT